MASQRYVVRAVDASERIVELELDAVDEPELLRQLAARQLASLSYKLAARPWRDVLGNKRGAFDLLLFAQELLALTSAGLGVAETLETLLERAPSSQSQQVIQRTLDYLRQGLRLSQAMQQQPDVFPPLLIGVIQSSEDTSDLPRALQRYIQYETQLRQLRHKIASATIYPLILMGVGALVALFLMGYVVPRFASVYQGGARELPVASQWLLVFGQWLSEHRWGVILVLALCTGLLGAKVRELRKHGQWWQILRLLPGAAPRLDVLELSRLYLTLGMLLEGGLPIGRAMQLASSVLGASRQAAWDRVRQWVTEGVSLTSAMEQQGFCTNVASRLLRVGERSGQIGLMLGKAAAFYDAETSRWIDTFSKAFEPILMAAIGIVIGLIVILLYIPVFDLAGSLQ